LSQTLEEGLKEIINKKDDTKNVEEESSDEESDNETVSKKYMILTDAQT
jgi:hypothetical protein